jgi:hypothetical protein
MVRACVGGDRGWRWTDPRYRNVTGSPPGTAAEVKSKPLLKAMKKTKKKQKQKDMAVRKFRGVTKPR